MSNGASSKGELQRAADIVAAAGGRLVGRTRLQKLAYLLELAGLGEGFDFQYRHYGPYSEGLALATHDASLIGLIHEEELPASWGGSYSVFTTTRSESNPLRQQIATVAAAANAVELELAATAAFLSVQGYGDPWDETARRKPDKAADGRLQKARELYGQFARVRTPNPIPDIA